MFESSPDDFSWLLWYSTFQMAACPGLTQLLVLIVPPKKKYSLCHLSATEPQSPQKVTQWSECLEMFRVETTSLSLHTAKLDEPRSDIRVCDSDAAVHTGFERVLKIQRL